MSFILAIDLGSSQMKLLLMDQSANVVDVVTAGYATKSSGNGYLTQQPMDWEHGLRTGLQKLKQRQAECLNNIEAISFSGHMSGVVLLDKNGSVLYPCIMLADSRSHEECGELQEMAGERISQLTGNPVINAFSLPKLLWLKKQEPECYEKTWVWLSPKDYLRFLLTGQADTEYTDAYNSLCVDRKTKDWSYELIASVGLHREKFPVIHGPCERAGEVTKTAAGEFGLKQGTPVYYGAADMACAAVGNRLFEEGDSTLTLGTCATFLAMVSDAAISCQGKVTYHMHVIPETYYALGSHFNGGLAVNWFSGLFSEGEAADYELVKRLSAEGAGVPAGSCGVMTLPFLAGSGSPYFRPEDSQSVLGVTVSTTRGQLFRSLLEGITYNLKQSLELFEQLHGRPLNPIVLGGGGIKIGIWPQIAADILGTPMELAANPDASSIGAALIGGHGCGLYPDLKQASAAGLRISGTLIPGKDNREIYEKGYAKYQHLYEALQKLRD